MEYFQQVRCCHSYRHEWSHGIFKWQLQEELRSLTGIAALWRTCKGQEKWAAASRLNTNECMETWVLQEDKEQQSGGRAASAFRILELLRLEETSRIRVQPLTQHTMFSSKPYLSVWHLHIFSTLPGMLIPSLPWAACPNAWQPIQWRISPQYPVAGGLELDDH